MASKSISVKVSSTIGSVSAEAVIPSKATAIITLAHGAGAGLNPIFMQNLAASLAEVGIGTFRFNFPFMENGKKRPDSPAVAHQTIQAAIQKTEKLYPKLPLFVSGKSFGGRMSSQLLSENVIEPVRGIIFYGFPLHPAGKPSTERAEHLKKIKLPMLFIQGTKDTLAEWKLITKTCASLRTATLVKIEGADHSFKAGKVDTMALITAATKDWIGKNL